MSRVECEQVAVDFRDLDGARKGMDDIGRAYAEGYRAKFCVGLQPNGFYILLERETAEVEVAVPLKRPPPPPPPGSIGPDLGVDRGY